MRKTRKWADHEIHVQKSQELRHEDFGIAKGRQGHAEAPEKMVEAEA